MYVTLLQAVFFKLAQYHGFFAPKTKTKVIKDVYMFVALNSLLPIYRIHVWYIC